MKFFRLFFVSLSAFITYSPLAQQPSVAASPTHCLPILSKNDFSWEINVSPEAPVTEGARMSRDGQRISYFFYNKLRDGSESPASEKFNFRYFDLQSGLALSGFADNIQNPKIIKATCYKKCESPSEWGSSLHYANRANDLISVYKYGIIEKIGPYKNLANNIEFFRYESLIKNLTAQAARRIANLQPTSVDVTNIQGYTVYASASLITYQGCDNLRIILAIDYSNWRYLLINTQAKTIYFSEATAPHISETYSYSNSKDRQKYLELQAQLESVLRKIEKFQSTDQNGVGYKNITTILNAFNQYKALLK